ncbi:MAG: metallophosphoesterase [Negativicutes bacterium]
MKKIRFILVLVFILAQCSLALAFDTVKFAVISDPHISIPQQKGVADGFKLGLQSQMLVEKTVAELNKIPDLKFVLVAGDLTQDAEPWNIDALRRILDVLTVPYFVTLGNHDLSAVPHNLKDQPITLSKFTVAGAFLGKSGGMVPGYTYYAKEVAKDLLLINLDTSRAQVYDPNAGMNDFGGYVDPAQLRWLENTLKANQDKTIIVLHHHNIADWAEGDKTNHNSWSWFKMDNGDAVQALFKRYKVKAVFTGHHHISTRYQDMGGVFHFVHPSLVTYPMRYTLYDITPKGLKYEVRDVPVSAEVLALAKKHFMNNKWWRDADQTDTPEGNKRYLDFYESPGTMKGNIVFK